MAFNTGHEMARVNSLIDASQGRSSQLQNAASEAVLGKEGQDMQEITNKDAIQTVLRVFMRFYLKCLMDEVLEEHKQRKTLATA